MTPTRLPASFRDPSGHLFEHDGVLYRRVEESARPDYERLMGSGLYEAAVRDGLLVPHEEVSDVPGGEGAWRVLRPERIPFVSHPYEWCFGQLRDAALLTLRLQRLALEHGLCLKDASGYNVQFAGGRPVFIDTLSFAAYQEGAPWVAYRQFCMHFLAPLALMARTDVALQALLRTHLDGVPLPLASRLLPWRSRLRLPLLLHVHLHARTQRRHEGDAEAPARAHAARMSKAGMLGLVDSLRSAVRGLHYEPRGTEWGEYYADTNYSEAALEAKRQAVDRLIERAAPATVWDLGANTGRFSRLASDRGIPTIAFDVDPAAVETSYRRVRAEGERHLLPLRMDLTNPSPALGWDHRERASLTERGPADLVMALALIHHLAIGHNVPLAMVARMLARLGRQLIVEFVPKQDSQVQRLLAAREDVFRDYDEAAFLTAFSECFEPLQRIAVEGSERSLHLMRRKAAGKSC